MPDQPDPKRRPLDAVPPRQPAAIPYAELHCKTNFSFLEGASHPDELVYRAAELGYRALAITDRNSLAGVVRAHVAAKQAQLKLLIGAELTPADAPAVVLLATDRQAYGRLVAADYRGPPKCSQRRMPIVVQRHRRLCRRIAGRNRGRSEARRSVSLSRTVRRSLLPVG